MSDHLKEHPTGTQYFPPLRKDKSFWGITATQFLGAFNDNLFKMLLLLLCADFILANNDGDKSPYFDPYQTAASLLFASSFLMFSGFAGFLSDRYRKKTIVVLCKVAEIAVMALGLLVLISFTPGSFTLILVLYGVLFLMGVQSAFFGPSKYGILPELFSDADLPTVNGAVVGTTFLAIIFGTALAGILKDLLGENLWMINLVCIALAVVGTFTALLIRKNPAAQPTLKFNAGCIFIEKSIWRVIFEDRTLFRAILVYSVFWFIGGVIALTITLTGQIQLKFSATVTSLLNASVGVGIGSGSVVAAMLSQKQVRMGLVKVGCVGVFLGTLGVAIAAIMPLVPAVKAGAIGALLLCSGFAGGLIAIPLQVFIQARPAAELKGRVIAAMNLMTWIGIAFASVYYIAVLAATGFRMDPSWIMLTCGIIMLVAGLASNLKGTEQLVEERNV